jgi:hypothetical protein
VNHGLASIYRWKLWPVPGWIPAVALIVATAAAASALGELSRPLFVLGCGAVGWYAWRQSPSAHLQVALTFFAFAPFVRRVVDLSIGYDKTGLMLIGPLLAILVPVPRLLEAPQQTPERTMALLLAVGGCAAYATVLSLFQGDWLNAASGALKWFAPLLYAAVLTSYAKRDEIIQSTSSAFLLILPIIGLYGIFQYVDPPSWDRYWMEFAPILSVGDPVPYGVRTFSTMNSPASFATFTVVGLIIICFSQVGWKSVLPVCLAGIALLLSLYRTAWISLAVALLFCVLFSSTRRRAVAIMGGTIVAVVLAATVSPFGDVISERVATFIEGAQDGSALERFDEFVTLWNQWDSSLFGIGFSTTDVGSAGKMPVDGMIIECWLSMGIIVGLICLSGLVLTATNTILAAWVERGREAIIIGALGCIALVQLPLANMVSGETGFLFWTFAALATHERHPDEGPGT